MDHDADQLVGHLREYAAAVGGFGSPLYGMLLGRVADDVAALGSFADLLNDHRTQARGSAVGLRLLGAVHRIVLRQHAPELAAYYPSAGGSVKLGADDPVVWQAFRDVVLRHQDEVRDGLDQAPQTNEVGRAAGLVGALLGLVDQHRLPIRLAEIGASAGLNLRADQYRYVAGDGGAWGPSGSRVVLDPAWQGQPLPYETPIETIERLGADLNPIDPASAAGRLNLLSYVWPDQLQRFARLEAALDIAAAMPVQVDRVTAGRFVAELELAPGAITVLWHSVTWQYIAVPERRQITDRVKQLGERTTARSPFAYVRLEPAQVSMGTGQPHVVTATIWPGGRERVLADAHPHGVPTTWR